eukprot:m.48771 g.48771  ORF g.48771 m.48771 type:complete len:596 (+) comp10585_c0_seq1:192-1979(+)
MSSLEARKAKLAELRARRINTPDIQSKQDEHDSPKISAPAPSGPPSSGRPESASLVARRAKLEQLRAARKQLTYSKQKEGSGEVQPAIENTEAKDLKAKLAAATEKNANYKAELESIKRQLIIYKAQVINVQPKHDEDKEEDVEDDGESEELQHWRDMYHTSQQENSELLDQLLEAQSRLGDLPEGFEAFLSQVPSGVNFEDMAEEFKVQQEALEEYEVLLNQTTAEVEDLRGQTKYQRELHADLDETLEACQTENQNLLATIDELTKLQRSSQTINNAKKPDIALLPDMQTEQTLRDELESAVKESKLALGKVDGLQAEIINLNKKLNDSSSRLQENESHLEYAENQIKEERSLREDAEDNLRKAVQDIEAEEGRLLSELELQKSMTANLEMSIRIAERRYEMELDNLKEERDSLEEEIKTLQLANKREKHLQEAHEAHNDNPAGDSLLAELSNAGHDPDKECQECSDLKTERKKLKKQLRNARAQVKQLTVDVEEKGRLLDQVIKKWSETVSSFMVHRPGDPTCPCDNCTGIKACRPQQSENSAPTTEIPKAKHSASQPATTETRKKRQPRLWGRLLPTRTASTSKQKHNEKS